MDFVNLWIASGLTVSKAEIIFFVRGNGPYLMSMMLSGFVLCFGAIAMMDQHDNWSARRTMFAAFTCIAIFVLLAAFLIRMTFGQGPYYLVEGEFFDRFTREVVSESAVVIWFLFFFGLFLEGSETPEEVFDADPAPGRLKRGMQWMRETGGRMTRGSQEVAGE
ncbi:hypothetical protein [Mesobacterium pallidum]|uniref:hypothetical protein n=1 Tax=Mesobacterium pallidum TaxID=2872037 RepID=UPI001EE26D2B|nr:hypothetical protein [Mesobacterium pallidum]